MGVLTLTFGEFEYLPLLNEGFGQYDPSESSSSKILYSVGSAFIKVVNSFFKLTSFVFCK